VQIQLQRMTCNRCSTVFDAETVVNAPVSVAMASLQAVTCPKCGAGSSEVGFGGELPGGQPGPDAPIEVRAAWWWDQGERGTSSETIFAACAPRGIHRPDHPYDPSDYRRCRRLLDIVPEWRAQLHRVTERWPWWAPFERRWAEFDRLWDEEIRNHDGRAPRLYAAIQAAVAEATPIRVRDASDPRVIRIGR
jgi:hypothetical protein